MFALRDRQSDVMQHGTLAALDGDVLEVDERNGHPAIVNGCRGAGSSPHCRIGYFGGGRVDEGAGLPSTVLGSISSTRVPSGSNRLSWRLRLIPVRISSGRV